MHPNYQSINMSPDQNETTYSNGDANGDMNHYQENPNNDEDEEENSPSLHFNDSDSFDSSFGSRIIKDDRKTYQWRKFVPSFHPKEIFSWLVHGFSPNSELDIVEVEKNTIKLARMISLLREYEDKFGIPQRGGAKDQLWVLTELCRCLYASGTPLWVLKPVMSKAAEGLTGSRLVDFVLFTRSGFVYSPSNITTATFAMERGFDIRMVTLAERVLVRLASFASNSRVSD